MPEKNILKSLIKAPAKVAKWLNKLRSLQMRLRQTFEHKLSHFCPNETTASTSLSLSNSNELPNNRSKTRQLKLLVRSIFDAQRSNENYDIQKFVDCLLRSAVFCFISLSQMSIKIIIINRFEAIDNLPSEVRETSNEIMLMMIEIIFVLKWGWTKTTTAATATTTSSSTTTTTSSATTTSLSPTTTTSWGESWALNQINTFHILKLFIRFKDSV